MTGESGARPTAASPGAERPDGRRPSRRELAASRRADAEPTLAETLEELGILMEAERLMERGGWSCLSNAIANARARVSAARRRSGYDDQD